MLRLRWVALMLAVAFFHEDITDVVKPLITISKKGPPGTGKPGTRKIVPRKPGLASIAAYPGPNPPRGGKPAVVKPSTDVIQPGTRPTVNNEAQTPTSRRAPHDTFKSPTTTARTHLADIISRVTLIPTDKEKETLLVPGEKRQLSRDIVKSNFLDDAAGGKQNITKPRGNNIIPGATSQHVVSSAVATPDQHEATPVSQGMMHVRTNSKTTRDQGLGFLEQLKEGGDEGVEVSDESTSNEPRLSATIIGLRPIYTREAASNPPGSNATLKEEAREEITSKDSLWNIKVFDFTFIWIYGFELLCCILYSTVVSRILSIRKYYKLSVKEYELTLESTRSFISTMKKETELHGLKQERLNRTWNERQSFVRQEKEELEELLSNIQQYVIEDEVSRKLKLAQDDFNLMSEQLSVNALEGLDSIGVMDQRIKDLEPVTQQLKDELLLWESIVEER